jgi:hypothetical protein
MVIDGLRGIWNGWIAWHDMPQSGWRARRPQASLPEAPAAFPCLRSRSAAEPIIDSPG